MTQQHPIPPPELVEQWQKEPGVTAPFSTLPPVVMVNIPSTKLHHIATRAAQWGADQELEACLNCVNKWGSTHNSFAAELRAARRPKPLSLKRVALLQLDTLNADLGLEGKGVDLSQIRRALESIPDPT